MEGRLVRCTYDFSSSHADELSLNQHDVVFIDKMIDASWVHGITTLNRSGIVPVGFLGLDACLPVPQPSRKYFFALESFAGNDPRDLIFNQYDVISGLSAIDDNWWEGELHDHRGIFPLSHTIELAIPSFTDCGVSGEEGSCSATTRRAIVKQSLTAIDADEINLEKGEVVFVEKSIDKSYFYGRSVDGLRCGTFPKNFVEIIEEQAVEPTPISLSSYSLESQDTVKPYACVKYAFKAEMPGELSLSVGDIVYLIRHSGDGWLEGSYDGRSGLFPASFVNIVVDITEEENVAVSPSTECCDDMRNAIASISDQRTVLYDFNGEQSTDLSVQAGDIVVIVDMVDSDWADVVNVADGSTGWVPVGFLSPSEATSVPQEVTKSPVESEAVTYRSQPEPTYHNYQLPPVGEEEPNYSTNGNHKSSMGESAPSNGHVLTHRATYTFGEPPPTHQMLHHNACLPELSGFDPLADIHAPSVTQPRPTLPPKPLAAVSPAPAAYNEVRLPSIRVLPKQHPQVSSPIGVSKAPTERKEKPPRPSAAPTRKKPVIDLEAKRAEKEEQRRQANETSRTRLIEEILMSEQAYINEFKVCHRVVESERKKCSIEHTEALMLHAGLIISLADKLIAQLQREIQRPFQYQEIGSCFLGLKEQFESCIIQYCESIEETQAIFDQLESEPSGRQFLTRCLKEMQVELKCFSVKQTVMRPLQRILTYPLFLTELHKCTDDGHPDKPKLLTAVNLMAEFAQNVDETKRRRDLVVKYRKSGDRTIGDRISKLNLHSVKKKSSRLSMRMSSTIGLTHTTKDEEFDALETEFRLLQKTVKLFLADVHNYCDKMQVTMSLGDGIADDWHQLASFIKKQVSSSQTYRSLWQDILQEHTNRFFDNVKKQVCEPLQVLGQTFVGPDKLIEKRSDKLLDYDRSDARCEKVKSGDYSRQRQAQEELKNAEADYRALNCQLIAELPKLNHAAQQVLFECQKTFLMQQKTFTSNIRASMREVDPVDHAAILQRQHRSADLLTQISFFPSKEFNSSQPARLSAGMTNYGLANNTTSSSDSANSSHNSSPFGSIRNTFRQSSFGQTSTNSKQRPPINFPHKRQTKKDHDTLHLKYPPTKLYTVQRDHVPLAVTHGRDNMEIQLKAGDLVAQLIDKDPMGNSERWFVDNGVGQGFVPRDHLKPFAGTVEPAASPPPPTNGTAPRAPPPASLIDLSSPSDPGFHTPASHSADLLGLDFTIPPPTSALLRSAAPVRGTSTRPILRAVQPDPPVSGNSQFYAPLPTSGSTVVNRRVSTPASFRSASSTNNVKQSNNRHGDAPLPAKDYGGSHNYQTNQGPPVRPANWQQELNRKVLKQQNLSSARQYSQAYQVVQVKSPQLEKASSQQQNQFLMPNRPAPTAPNPSSSNTRFTKPPYLPPKAYKRSPVPQRKAPLPPPGGAMAGASVYQNMDHLAEAIPVTPPEDIEFYEAEFDFIASSESELTVNEGQMLAVLQKFDLKGNDQWWFVENDNQDQGYVPSNYLRLLPAWKPIDS